MFTQTRVEWRVIANGLAIVEAPCIITAEPERTPAQERGVAAFTRQMNAISRERK